MSPLELLKEIAPLMRSDRQRSKKQLLAIDLVVGDGLLAIGRYQPVDERLRERSAQ